MTEKNLDLEDNKIYPLTYDYTDLLNVVLYDFTDFIQQNLCSETVEKYGVFFLENYKKVLSSKTIDQRLLDVLKTLSEESNNEFFSEKYWLSSAEQQFLWNPNFQKKNRN